MQAGRSKRASRLRLAARRAGGLRACGEGGEGQKSEDEEGAAHAVLHACRRQGQGARGQHRAGHLLNAENISSQGPPAGSSNGPGGTAASRGGARPPWQQRQRHGLWPQQRRHDCQAAGSERRARWRTAGGRNRKAGEKPFEITLTNVCHVGVIESEARDEAHYQRHQAVQQQQRRVAHDVGQGAPKHDAELAAVPRLPAVPRG